MKVGVFCIVFLLANSLWAQSDSIKSDSTAIIVVTEDLELSQPFFEVYGDFSRGSLMKKFLYPTKYDKRLDFWKSGTLEFGVARNVPVLRSVTYHPIYFRYGLAFTNHWVHTKEGFYFSKNIENNISKSEGAKGILSGLFLHLPLSLEVHFDHDIKRKFKDFYLIIPNFKMGIGVYAQFLLSQNLKQSNIPANFEEADSDMINTLNFGLEFSAGYRFVTLYLRRDLFPFLHDYTPGQDKAMLFGIRLSLGGNLYKKP